MKTEYSLLHLVLIWLFGLIVVSVGLAVSGQSITPFLYQELERYSHSLGTETGVWIMHQAQYWYRHLMTETGIQAFLLKYTTPDGHMGSGLTKTLLFFKEMANNMLTLILLLLVRIALLSVCLPFWGLILVAAVLDGLLIRKIRYHDFHYTSPLRNLWSRRLCRWIPGLLLYLIIVPLPLPVWLIPFMAVVTSLCMGWWAANWQKRV